ncbi:open rectifier potassium channel protein 1-like [Penaeus monodon]|uniref:open rectifier potassium channel protein 1-like n=1 Tax=Penaeus monodon TaxID=6687 RepID=UPI0018A739B9|nr:open rectifier potassium channel protein 1-like [Penaeus monodon]
MMSFKQWLVLLGLYTIYMLIGAAVFISLEKDNEMEGREELLSLKGRVIDFVEGLDNESRPGAEVVLKDVSDVCGHDFLSAEDDEPLTWSLWNSFFFTFTVITTIGFGHMSPATPWGRVFCIAYALFGVPLNGILVAVLADIFSCKMVNSRVRARAKRYESWMGVATDTVLYLVPGFILFLVVPAAVLLAFEEGWNYLDSFYFAFITLTTIGFGDYVAGRQDLDHMWIWTYKILMVVWIVFGLGYIVMIITFIQKALKSKKIHRVEQKVARTLKRQAAKIHQNLHTDLKRLREVVTALSVLPDNSEEDCSKEKTLKRCASQPTMPQGVGGVEDKEDHTLPRSVTSQQSQPPADRVKTFRQALSEAAVNNVGKKDQFRSLSSLEDVALFLEMVESLLREHEAGIAKEADDQAHHILSDDDSNSSDDDSFGTEATDVPHKEDLEAGFCNQAFVGDKGEVEVVVQKPCHVASDASKKGAKEDEPGVNQRVQQRLNYLLKEVDPKSSRGLLRQKSLKEGVTSSGQLLGEMESIVCKPFSNPDIPDTCSASDSLSRVDRRSSNSVPGRIKSGFVKSYPNLSDVFPTLPSSCDAVDHQPGSQHDPEKRASRRWSFGSDNRRQEAPHDGHHAAHNFLAGIKLSAGRSAKDLSSSLSLLSQWIHGSAVRTQGLQEAEKEREKERDSVSSDESQEATKPQYTRL